MLFLMIFSQLRRLFRNLSLSCFAMSTIDSDDDDDDDDKNNSDNDNVINNIKYNNNDSNNDNFSLAPISIVTIFISA